MKMPLEIGRVLELWLVSDCNGREPERRLENAGPGGEPRAETGNNGSDTSGVNRPPDGLKRHESGQGVAQGRDAAPGKDTT